MRCGNGSSILLYMQMQTGALNSHLYFATEHNSGHPITLSFFPSPKGMRVQPKAVWP